MAQHLTALLRPSLLAPRPLARRHPRPPQRLIRRRQRLLTRPVMVAIVVGLVWRRVPAVAAGQKVWARAGLWGGPPLPVSPQALPNRLDVLLAAVLGQLGAAVWTRVQAQAAPSVGHPRWAPVREHCPLMALGDGAPLAALRQRTQVLREGDGVRRAGKTLVLVAAFSHRPRWPRSTAAAAAHDQRFAAASLAALPVGGVVVCAVGFCRWLWCDACPGSQPCGVTRRREQTAARTGPVLRGRPDDRDELLHLGQYRSHPGPSPRRMVSGRWQGPW